MLLQYPNNKADVNATNKMGFTAYHILLAKLLDLANLQNKSQDNRPGKVSGTEKNTIFKKSLPK